MQENCSSEIHRLSNFTGYIWKYFFLSNSINKTSAHSPNLIICFMGYVTFPNPPSQMQMQAGLGDSFLLVILMWWNTEFSIQQQSFPRMKANIRVPVVGSNVDLSSVPELFFWAFGLMLAEIITIHQHPNQQAKTLTHPGTT